MDMMLNGKPADISDFEADELAAAVLISLFSWRKSNPDDGVKAPNRQGWWGDTFAEVAGRSLCNGSSMMRLLPALRFLRSARGLTRSRCWLPVIALTIRRHCRPGFKMFGSENGF